MEDLENEISQGPQKKPKLNDNKKKKGAKKDIEKKSKIQDENDTDDKSTQFEKNKKKQKQQSLSDDQNSGSDSETQEKPQKKSEKGKKKANDKKEKDKDKNKKGENKAKEKPTKGQQKKAPKGKQPHIKEDADSLLNYMKEMNRPFTLNYLKDTLFLKPGPLAKNLETLLKNNDIIQKDVGASKVFLYNQALLPEVDKDEMEKLTKDLNQNSEELKYLNQENNKLQEQLKQIQKILKLSEIENQILDYEKQIEEQNNKMQLYQSSQFSKASKDEVEWVESEYKRIEDLCLKRKKLYMNTIDTVLDGSEMTVKEFEVIAGIQRE